MVEECLVDVEDKEDLDMWRELSMVEEFVVDDGGEKHNGWAESITDLVWRAVKALNSCLVED